MNRPFEDSMPSPAISVIVATHNMGRFLPEALDSLLRQSLSRSQFEVLVVDDGSSDDTGEVLASYSRKVKIIRQPHSGLVAAVSNGSERSRGRYLIRVDADDWVDPDMLFIGMRLLDENPTAACVISDRYEVRDKKRSRVRIDPKNLYTLVACGTLFRMSMLRQAGGYRPVYWEEYDLYLRLRQLGEFLYAPLPLYFYRKHSSSMTHKAQERRRGWRQLLDCWGAQALLAAGDHEELRSVLEEHDP